MQTLSLEQLEIKVLSPNLEILALINKMDLESVGLARIAIDNYTLDKLNRNFLFTLFRTFGKNNFEDYSLEDFISLTDFLDNREIEIHNTEPKRKTNSEVFDSQKILLLESSRDITITNEFKTIVQECNDPIIQMKLRRFFEIIEGFCEFNKNRLVSSLDFYINDKNNPKLPNNYFTILNSNSYKEIGMGGYGKLRLTYEKRVYLKVVDGKFEFYALPNFKGLH